jgi:hypothetical protein
MKRESREFTLAAVRLCFVVAVDCDHEEVLPLVTLQISCVEAHLNVDGWLNIAFDCSVSGPSESWDQVVDIVGLSWSPFDEHTF